MHADDRAARASPRAPATIVGAALLMGAAVPTLAGCAVGPTFATPQTPVLEKWSGASDPRITTQNTADSLWWKAFNDPALDRLVDLAHRQNLPLQVAGLRIVEARAQFGVATGRQFPQTQELFASGEGRWAHRESPDYNRGLGTATYSPIRSASMPPGSWTSGASIGGASSRRPRACSRRSPTTSAALVSLTGEVARSDVALRTAEVLIKRAEDNAQIQEEALGIARPVSRRARLGAGSDPGGDAARERPGHLPRLGTLSRRRETRSPAARTAGGQHRAAASGPKDIPKPPAKVAVGVPAEMLRRRPDIRVAEMSAAAQCARIGVAKAELYPSFSLIGTIGLRALNTGTASAMSS